MRHYFDLKRFLDGLIFGPLTALGCELGDLVFADNAPRPPKTGTARAIV